MSLKASQLLGITCLGAFQKLPSASNFHSQSLSFSDSAHNTLAPSFSSTIFAHDFNKLRTDSLNCGSAVLKRLRSYDILYRVAISGDKSLVTRVGEGSAFKSNVIRVWRALRGLDDVWKEGGSRKGPWSKERTVDDAWIEVLVTFFGMRALWTANAAARLWRNWGLSTRTCRTRGNMNW